MELTRLRTLAGITLTEASDERKAPANLTVKPTGKDPMSVKHAAGADPRDAAPANLTVKPAGKNPMSVKHSAGADPRSAAPKNLTVKAGGNKAMKKEEIEEHDALVEAIVATLNSTETIVGLKAIAASIVNEATNDAAAKKLISDLGLDKLSKQDAKSKLNKLSDGGKIDPMVIITAARLLTT